MSLQGIIFDKDGVLFDFRATWESWAKSLLMRLCDNDAGRAQIAGQAVGFDLAQSRFDASSVIIAGTLDEIAQGLSPYVAVQKDLLGVLRDEASVAPQVETVPLRAFMQDLKARGLRLGVATNDAIDPATAHLKSANVFECFDMVAGYDSGHGAKPEPGQLLAFCAQTGLAPEHCLMVGDSLHDMIAGQRAGMQTLGVLTGMAPAEILAPHATAVLPDIGHIPAWLDLQNDQSSLRYDKKRRK